MARARAATTRPGPTADVIVVAAGRSERMGGTDKMLADVAGRPLLDWTLAAVAASPRVDRVVVVVPTHRVDAIRAATWLPPSVVAVVPGGGRRQESVAAGFAALEAAAPSDDDRIVLVHDGARPLVTTELIDAVIDAVADHGAAVPIVPIRETVKRIDGDRVGATLDRDQLGTAGTPQGMRRGLLRQAFDRFPSSGSETWTDEAALLEACRIEVHVVPGDPSNLKVTLPADLHRAQDALPSTRAFRTGIGHDSHPFGPNGALALGGIVIAAAPALRGHSDGDVAIHAICDALLGAAGAGDLGRVFPAGADTPAGIDSGEMLREVVGRVTARDCGIVNVDVTIIAARPRLADHLDAMRMAIATALAVPGDRVNVKASSGNLAGDEGAGRGIAAIAVATLESVR